MRQKFEDRSAVIGVVGLGYVGMPLASAALNSGFRVIGFDIDRGKVEAINAGQSYLKSIPEEFIGQAVAAKRFSATTDMTRVGEADAIIICVPTPLTAHREPDLSLVVATARAIAPHVRRGHLIVLESTTWPGTTAEVLKPIIEEHGLRSGHEFSLAFSPEREDPGNQKYSTHSIPKVVGADDIGALEAVDALYSAVVSRTVQVSSTKTAEAVKLTENIFRAVNIALVNELKVVYQALGIDVWEVIEAASTKPFGYMPFYPGPGLGGHCIPIDPFYLTWKAREHEITTRFIELAGEINTAMPGRIVDSVGIALDRSTGKGLSRARILLVGMAYKKNVEDIRESASLKLMQLLEERGAKVSYFDPYIIKLPITREYPHLGGREVIKWSTEQLTTFDLALIATDHDEVDYEALCENVPLIVDTRNICARRGLQSDRIVKA